MEHGKADVVLDGRRAFQDAMEPDAIEAVQRLSGRRVIAFMSTNHISPDIGVEIFILQPLEREAADDGRPLVSTAPARRPTATALRPSRGDAARGREWARATLPVVRR